MRDWRCIIVALASWPFLSGLVLGALGPAIVLGIGLAWRFRDRFWTPAIVIASVVVVKLFPWTLLIWLIITRRFRTFALAILLGALSGLVAWAVIGFAGLSEYPRMLANLSLVDRAWGVSLVSALLMAGVPGGVADALAISAAALVLVTAYRFARRPDGDARALGLAVIAALLASPVVWTHYLVLAFVPIALLSPRLSVVWFVPLLSGLLHRPHPNSLGQVLFAVALEVGIAVYGCVSLTPQPSEALPSSLVEQPQNRRRCESVSRFVLMSRSCWRSWRTPARALA